MKKAGIGSTLDDFLKEDGTYEETTEIAKTRVANYGKIMKVTIEITLDAGWGDLTRIEAMTDEEIHALVKEAPNYALSHSKWTVTRPKAPKTT